jgi:peptidoglycan/LPS O-acetylase OafA/YrhL
MIAREAARVPELDAIRGLAAVAVLLAHLPRNFWLGVTGVDMFFVLSGYLITSIIVTNLDQPRFFRTFFHRRALRIWPIYSLALAGLLALSLVKRTPSDYEGWWCYVFYLQNVPRYWGGSNPSFLFSLEHTWTLAAAVVSSHAVERPLFVLKDRFPYSRGRRLKPAGEVAVSPHAASENHSESRYDDEFRQGGWSKHRHAEFELSQKEP